jgi:hypothetical protein
METHSPGTWEEILALPDDAMLRSPSEFPDLPDGTRWASSPACLRHLLCEIMPRAAADLIDDVVRHESEHAAVARALGCTSRFAVLFVEPTEPGFDSAISPMHWWISPHPLSKLAVAAIAAAPADPSAEDLEKLRVMGYRDAEDLANRIRKFNRHARHPLPMPAHDAGRR